MSRISFDRFSFNFKWLWCEKKFERKPYEMNTCDDFQAFEILINISKNQNREMETTISNCINLQIHFESEKLFRLKSKLLIHPFTKRAERRTCSWQTNVYETEIFYWKRKRSTKMKIVNILAFSCTNILVQSCLNVQLRLSRCFIKLN